MVFTSYQHLKDFVLSQLDYKEQPLTSFNPKPMEYQENEKTNTRISEPKSLGFKTQKGEKNKKDTTQTQHETNNKSTHLQDTMFKPFQPWKTSSPSKETKNRGNDNTKTKWQKTPQQKRGRQESNQTLRRVMTKETWTPVTSMVPYPHLRRCPNHGYSNFLVIMWHPRSRIWKKPCR